MDYTAMSILISTSLLVITIGATGADMCPRKCTCSGTSVTCTDTNMRNVPAGIPINTTSLVFSNNSLTTIRNQTQLHNLPMLRELYLRDNGISSIEDGSFWGQENLTILDISSNDLAILNRNTFRGLRSLKTLVLSNNQKLCLEFGSFENLLKLTKLVLGKTPINFIPGIFGVFSDESAPPFRLQELQLWNIGMSIVPYEALKHFPSLSTLNLSQNQMKCLPNSAFLGNGNLSHLDLSSNPISVVQNGAFQGLSRLAVLLLDNTNTLSMLPRGVFDPLPVSVQVCLFGSQWNCDCHIKWLKTWMEDPARVQCGHKPNCRSPPNLANNPLYLTPEELFVCDGSISSLPEVECHTSVLYAEGYCRELFPTPQHSTTTPIDLPARDIKPRRRPRPNTPARNKGRGSSAFAFIAAAVILTLIAVVVSILLRKFQIQKRFRKQNKYFNISYENGDQQLRMADNPYRETETFY